MYVKLTKKCSYCKIRGVSFDNNDASARKIKSIYKLHQNLPRKSVLQTLLDWFVINFVVNIVTIIIIFWNGERFDRNPPLLGYSTSEHNYFLNVWGKKKRKSTVE